jgi:hypothetical protein
VIDLVFVRPRESKRMSAGNDAFLEKKAVRVMIKVLVGVMVTCVAVVFFGLCLPFLLLGLEVLPGLGVGGFVYMLAGGVIGLLFGGISSIISLGRSEKPVTLYCAILFAALSLLSVAYWVAYMNIESLQHV